MIVQRLDDQKRTGVASPKNKICRDLRYGDIIRG